MLGDHTEYITDQVPESDAPTPSVKAVAIAQDYVAGKGFYTSIVDTKGRIWRMEPPMEGMKPKWARLELPTEPGN